MKKTLLSLKNMSKLSLFDFHIHISVLKNFNPIWDGLAEASFFWGSAGINLNPVHF